MQEEQIKKFIEDYKNGKYSEEEHLRFMDWLKNASKEQLKIITKDYIQQAGDELSESNNLHLADKIEERLDEYDLTNTQELAEGKLRRMVTFRKVAAIAAIILVIIGNIWMLAIKKEKMASPIVKKEAKKDVVPGSNKATLVLANGSTIILDTANGMIAQQSDAKIVNQNGQLSYSASKQNPEASAYNIISVPVGGQYQLRLSDGTKVWLNASSSLRYPVTFFGKERKVELTGEGYFEVEKNASMPFKINIAGKEEVEVLGTHFNINAYDDEATINTTLFEGKVRLKGITDLQKQNTTDLIPGEQAQLNKNGRISLLKDLDLEAVIAWKNGYFSFAESDIHTIMRQLSRWYNIDVAYESQISERRFGGEIARSNNLSDVLKVLEESKIHFKTEGRKIIVLP